MIAAEIFSSFYIKKDNGILGIQKKYTNFAPDKDDTSNGKQLARDTNL